MDVPEQPLPFIVPKLNEPGAMRAIMRYLRGETGPYWHASWGPGEGPKPLPKPMEMGRDEDY